MATSEPTGDITDTGSLDPESLGFMCGLEIHQQLATGKLHSRQPCTLYDYTIETIPEDWPKETIKPLNDKHSREILKVSLPTPS